MEVKENMKNYSNDGRFKIYLAGPFFNEEQIERINFIEDLLDKYNIDIFSPRQASLIKPGCSQEDMKKTFEGNTTNIDNADAVLAVLDGNDTGTMFECGYAYAIKKPTIYFNETRPEEKGPNLMLAMSTDLPYLQDTKATTAREYLERLVEDLSKGGLDLVKENYHVSTFDEVE